MPGLYMERLIPSVADNITLFLEEILGSYSANTHSIHVVGSAVTQDFNEKTSDINSVYVLKEMDLKFVELIAPLGRKYAKKRIAAPLIMTPRYIANSLDVFPIEFHDFKLIHETVLGEDIFSSIPIDLDDLRRQCEREIKSKLIGLRQGYIASQGDRKMITERFAASIAGYMPLFRGIILLMGKKPPVSKNEVISLLGDTTGVNTDVFRRVLDMKRGQLKPDGDELKTIFETYYEATEKIGKLVDEHRV